MFAQICKTTHVMSGRGTEGWEGGFAKVWLPNPKAGPDCKIIQSPIPLRCWSNDSDWSFHSFHGYVSLHLIRSRILTSCNGNYFRVRTSEDKVCRRDMCWSVRIVCILIKLPDVNRSGLVEAGRYSLITIGLIIVTTEKNWRWSTRLIAREETSSLACSSGRRRDGPSARLPRAGLWRRTRGAASYAFLNFSN